MQYKQTFSIVCAIIIAIYVHQAKTAPPEVPEVPQIIASTTAQPTKADKSDSNRSFFAPVVSVDRNDNKSKVAVHVPLFFEMTNDVAVDHRKLDLSVLSGLVKVTRDKSIQEDGSLTGPVTVTIFGIPVYTGARDSTPSRAARPRNEPVNESKRTTTSPPKYSRIPEDQSSDKPKGTSASEAPPDDLKKPLANMI